jgi:hypothetical protein
MKKVLLLILVVLAISSFFFFTPVLLLMLGLCCLGVGIVSVIHPERMSFDWFRHPSWIRAAGSVLFLFGSLASLAGGTLTDQLYFKNQPTSTSEADAKWTTVGSAPSRPMTHPASTAGGTGKTNVNVDTQQHSLLQTVKEWIKPSAPPQNKQIQSTNTTTPAQPDQNGTSSSAPPTATTDQRDFPGKKRDHPGNGRGNGPKVK